MGKKGEFKTRGFFQLIGKIFEILRNSSSAKKELLTTVILSFIICVVCYNCPSWFKVIQLEDVKSPYITLLGFSLSSFAIFISDIGDIIELDNRISNSKDVINDLLSISILGLIIPILGLIPNMITIPGFSIAMFTDNTYWNLFFCSLSILWVCNSILHVISLKVIDNSEK